MAHIVWRDSDGKYHDGPAEGRRAYGDFREFADVGGGREALAPVKPGGSTGKGTAVLGSGWATTDPEIADDLFDKRKAELKAKRRGGATNATKSIGLRSFAAKHLREKARKGNTSDRHMVDLEQRLGAAVDYFGADRDLNTIDAEDVEQWVQHLAAQPNGRGGTLSPVTQRNYLFALSGLYRRAQAQKYVAAGYNPVALLPEKPKASTTTETRFFEVHEAALILEAAKVVEAQDDRPNATDGLYPIIATFLLTGGRKAEVLGLEVEDVSFDQGRVHFRPNDHRGLKTKTSHRIVPLWPQLREILHDWMYPEDGTPRVSGLLFPSRTGGMVEDLRKSLETIADLTGLHPDDLRRTKTFRHTYCSARLQTVQRIVKPGKDPATDEDPYEWVPVQKFTVQKEMGHGGSSLVDRVYGHVGESPHRSEVVEYRVDKHREVLGERLVALEAKV